uniref:RING-type domain-containing protein n=1 Tax=Strigamia maritima TaxID=126957 RepID=T1IUT6_STRMM
MFYCDSCFFKLHKKSRFSCGHVLCKNCVYLDEINNGVCPLDKNSVWIENADNENAEKKKMQIEISEEIEQIEISEEIKQIEISEEIKQIEISEEIDQIEISEEIEQIEISEEIEDVKKETALLKYSADRLVRQNEIKDILKLQKDDIKLYLDEFMDSIDDRLETIDHTLYALTEKIVHVGVQMTL